MKKYAVVIAGGVVALLSMFCFFGSRAIGAEEPGPAQGQTPEHGAQPTKSRSAQAKQGSMPGTPGKVSEKPTAKSAATSKDGPVAAPDRGGPGQVPTEAPIVEIPTDKQRLLGVKIATVSVQPLEKTIRTVGLVEYDQRRVNTVNTKIEGWIEKLDVNFTGIYVKKGDPIADIYSPELWATQQEFINMVKWAKRAKARSEVRAQPSESFEAGLDIISMIDKDAQSLIDAARQRLRLWDISDAQIKSVEESEKPIRTLTVYSPFSGYVLQKNVNQGQRVMSGEKLIDIADLSTVWIWADIYEFELPLIKVGDKATIQLSYMPGKQFSTQIDYINPVLEGGTRTAKARFTVPNEAGLIKPQMFTNVEITINLGRTLVVPTEAVINTGVRKVAYIDKGDGNFEPREVTTGTATDRVIEITAGLKAGDRVASSANFLIDSEAKLKGVEPLPRKPASAQPKTGGVSASSPPPQHRH
jgi:membrane fusion protein, copper/silver efflux system